MTLGQQQRIFTQNVARLILYAYEQEYELTLGEAHRPTELVKIYKQDGRGSGNSLHPDRLAIDLNLFKNGLYLRKSEDHFLLGAFWKTLHPLNRWGGDFKFRKDGNHYSMARGNRA